MALSDRRQRFCYEYMKDLNATQAAIRAGYKEKAAPTCGWRLLMNVEVKQEIARLKAERAEIAMVNATWVLLEAKRTYEAAQDAEDVRGRVSALTLIGKHVDVQALKDKVENDGVLNVVINKAPVEGK